ncbi:uncharacterized protein LOC116300685 [Actinia tenebrosa]|uniref:Uncharacterized protein LOC116300685 n=1 Tax=Actinia tenebrosa TaxID=6105 RepID=A0A6P8IFD5_ACTTE|nr:uncharacterized protein LOC116300685 [Actinia tenebrosa]
MRECSLVLLLIVTLFTTADSVAAQSKTTDNYDVSSAKVVANSLIEGLLSYSKRKNGSPLPPRLDLVFILDTPSSECSSKQFGILKVFLQNLVKEFSISPSTTRIGLIRCSANASLQFGLDHFMNRECALKALKNLRYHPSSRCSLNSAFDLARRIVFKKNDLHAKKLVFLLSAEKQRHDKKTVVSAANLRRNGVELFELCVRSHHRAREDKRIASKPMRTHRLHVDDYDALVEVADQIKGEGLGQSCSTTGTVYDECRRRCRCSNGQMIDCYRVRKEFTSMTLEERRLYIHALKTVSSLQPYKRMYDTLTTYHPLWFKGVHRLKYFFPWHRWYILIFENFLRQVDCRVTVPYWDWSRAVSKGALFRASYIRDVWHPGPHALGGDGTKYDLCVQNGPFRKDSWFVYLILKNKSKPTCLTREFNTCYSQYLFNAQNVSKLFQLPLHKFRVFEKKVRRAMHDQFHNAIGGVMSLEESANAPEFWFHHGYLDKLWADWQKRGPKFKHQYYHGVTTNFPGTKIRGSWFIDLSRQPFCVKVVHDQPIDMEEREEDFDSSINEPVPIYWCR